MCRRARWMFMMNLVSVRSESFLRLNRRKRKRLFGNTNCLMPLTRKSKTENIDFNLQLDLKFAQKIKQSVKGLSAAKNQIKHAEVVDRDQIYNVWLEE